ncbi:MAG: hypothetical protein HDR47_06425 [Bacteroides sp.]|nr:hypothetical protein [Bacteroides sp.]
MDSVTHKGVWYPFHPEAVFECHRVTFENSFCPKKERFHLLCGLGVMHNQLYYKAGF